VAKVKLRGREEEAPSGVERARHLLDDKRLSYWLEQEQEPPGKHTIEGPVEERGRFDRVVLDRHAREALTECGDHRRRCIDCVGREAGLLQDPRARLTGPGAEVEDRRTRGKGSCPRPDGGGADRITD
jgi:hypothetical protein